jgi:hypothetical protein
MFGTSDLEDPGVDGKMILKLIFKKWNGGIDRIDLAQFWNSWLAVVNVVINLRAP